MRGGRRASSATRRGPAARSARAARTARCRSRSEGLAGIEGLLQRPLADAGDAGLTDRGAPRGARRDHRRRTSTTAASACGRCARPDTRQSESPPSLMSSATSSLNGCSFSNSSSGGTSRSGGVEPSSQRRRVDGRLPGDLVDPLVVPVAAFVSERIDRVEIDVAEAVPLFLVVLEPRLAALGRDRGAADLLAEGRVLVTVLVARDEARVAGLRLERLNFLDPSGLLHVPRRSRRAQTRHARAS